MVRLNVGGKLKYHGLFEDPIQAAKVADEAARRYWGDYAATNF
jgi:hypothetical protein